MKYYLLFYFIKFFRDSKYCRWKRPAVLSFKQVFESSPVIVTSRCASKGFSSPWSGGRFQVSLLEARQTVIKYLL